MLFQKKTQEVKETKKKKIKARNYREIITNYIQTLKENNLSIKKISIDINELNEIDISIIGEEKESK